MVVYFYLNNEKSPGKLWTAGFIYLLVTNAVNASAFGMITPLVPGYVVSLGASLSFAGVVAGMISITALFARPLASVMGDRFNKKRLLVTAMSLNGFSVILYALAPGLLWLLPVRVLHGLMFSISGTVFFALGTDYIPQNRLGEGVGYLGIGQIVGMALGPNIGIYLLRSHSYRFCFALGGAGILIAGLSLMVLRDKYAHLSGSVNKVKRKFHLQDLIAVEVLPNALFVAILAVGNGLNNSYLVMLGIERSIGNIGLYFVINSAMLLLTRPFLGKMTDRKNSSYAIIPAYLMFASALTLIGFSKGLTPVLFAAVLASIGNGAMPSIQADCIKKLDSRRSTVATGTYFIGMDIGMFTGQLFGGVFIDSFGFRTAYHSAGFLMLIGLGFYLLYGKYSKRRKEIASK